MYGSEAAGKRVVPDIAGFRTNGCAPAAVGGCAKATGLAGAASTDKVIPSQGSQTDHSCSVLLPSVRYPVVRLGHPHDLPTMCDTRTKLHNRRPSRLRRQKQVALRDTRMRRPQADKPPAQS